MMESNSFSSQVQFLLALILLHALTWITGGRKQGFNAKPGWGSGTEVFFLKLGGGVQPKGPTQRGPNGKYPLLGGQIWGQKIVASRRIYENPPPRPDRPPPRAPKNSKMAKNAIPGSLCARLYGNIKEKTCPQKHQREGVNLFGVEVSPDSPWQAGPN